MHYVYILYSETTQRHYCGETQQLQDRLSRHNAGRSKSTKGGAPWKLVHAFECPNRSEARLLEKKIKGQGIGRFLKECGEK